MTIIAAGLAMLALGVVMMAIARPREGEMVPFLAFPYVETIYALAVTILIGVGILATLAGMVSLFGF